MDCAQNCFIGAILIQSLLCVNYAKPYPKQWIAMLPVVAPEKYIAGGDTGGTKSILENWQVLRLDNGKTMEQEKTVYFILTCLP